MSSGSISRSVSIAQNTALKVDLLLPGCQGNIRNVFGVCQCQDDSGAFLGRIYVLGAGVGSHVCFLRWESWFRVNAYDYSFTLCL